MAALIAGSICFGSVQAQNAAETARQQVSDEPPPATYAPPPVLTSNFLQDPNTQQPIAVNSELAPLQQPCRDCECCPHCHCYSCECPLQPAPCVPCPHVTTLLPFYNVAVFGAVQGNMLFNTARPIGPGTPFFLAPGPVAGLAQNTVDLHARSSLLGAAISGPTMGSFQAGGLVAFIFYDESIVLDRYGFIPLQIYGDLKNEDWRFAAGLQFNVFNPNLPTMLTFSSLIGSGNTGNLFNGQFRIERFLNPTEDTQWTIQAALSEPISTTVSNQLALNEDNGWPNVEGRIVYGVGTPEQVGTTPRRPLEIGVSGVVGQVRTTQLAMFQVVANVWGVGSDLRWKINDRCGIQGEFYAGQGLGNYGGSILQTTNTATFESIRSAGAWGEFWYYLNPCVHTHLGYGIDDPLDRDTDGPLRNTTFFANILWDVNKSFRLGFELTRRETAYRAPLQDNEGWGFHTQAQWSF